MFNSLYSFAPSHSYRFFFKSLLSSQRSRTSLVTYGFFLRRSFPSISLAASDIHGNHGIDIHVLITQANEWCELPIFHCLKSASHIWVPKLLNIKFTSWLVWLSRLLQTNSKGHHHQVMVTSYVCSRRSPCPMDVNS